MGACNQPGVEMEGAPNSYMKFLHKNLPFFGAKVLVTAICGATHLHGEEREREKKKVLIPSPNLGSHILSQEL
jgi:hypothetical protein